jgi:uncharacterized membrane protein
MFFAHLVLRPAANDLLDPPLRLPLMLAVFRRFFPWVWASIVLLWGSGFWLFLGVFRGEAGGHVHAMIGIALVMTSVFVYLWFLPYKRMRAAVAGSDWASAAARLAQIRKLILTNLLLGLLTALLGATGARLLAFLSA